MRDLFLRLLIYIVLIFSLTGNNILSAQEQGKGFKDSWTGIDFVFIKGGCFDMGDTFNEGFNNEKPVHKVCIKDFYLGRYEVTQGQWKAVMGDNPSKFKGQDNYPVENVSWDDAQEFIKRLNSKSEKKYRLPSEAEWEYACREGGKNQRFAGTSDISSLYLYGNFCDKNCEFSWKTPEQDDGYKNTAPIGTYKPNSLGLFDMTGNVWEWVIDVYDKDAYTRHETNNPVNLLGGNERVVRGGGWRSEIRRSRCSYRSRDLQNDRNMLIGLRLASD
ncbi:MAG TPA: SUMF1/EgtB/PvdO family nonheme iron enzyme [Syntrophorhabdaceae bacterium]|nr:SUMF1/EgtB/PvdO family nonheme iron enzyme [Syntrophorhabdaceae bacterium]HPC66173.1 SUMF1/EgtB/PvdO family nonheme iron enzyme [Syntrophorhabdaceae bacterium]HRR70877.1 SUMF1/EgtB/PvdO family nonheme iron enzyme [Syntrophorhabdaceae bacterium]HRV21735.1 SUMF1/EgtB/PvdO family nonheme iron enzyme [Syntrophorhabdaceae bacterium]